GLARAAKMLLGAGHPAIVCGDEVARSGALGALTRLAELTGALVHNEVLPARVNMPFDHPLQRTRMGQDQPAIRERLGDADVVLLVGGRFFEEVWFVDGDPFPAGSKVIHIDPVPANVGYNYRVDCGLVADVGVALEQLVEAIETQAGEGFKRAAANRMAAHSKNKTDLLEAQAHKADSDPGNRPMSTATLMHILREASPENVAVAGEAITAGADLLATFPFQDPLDYLASRGGGIGQGLPSAIGLKLAQPRRPVLCVSGDGSALYTIQALWTAAHHRIPIVFVIVNNGTYRILKLNMNRYRKTASIDADRGYPHLDLAHPPVDFVSTAEGLGVSARRVNDAGELKAAVEWAFDSNGPCLLDVSVDAGS
ncbi:MAG: thiamine pyrophosphate-binding protein, partial [Gammaproteobacteria bacterium]